MINKIFAKYVGGLYAEDECTSCQNKRMIHYIWQDSYNRIVAQFCASCSFNKNLTDGKEIATPHETVLI